MVVETRVSFAVKSLPALAKLATRSEPVDRSVSLIATAFASPYGWLVT